MFPTWLSLFAVIFALATAYFKFAIKLSILPSGPIDVSNPFSTPFILKNDSLLWINNVKPYQVIIRNINNRSMVLNVNLVAPAIPHLSSGETTTFILPVSEVVFHEKIIYIKIDIGVSYSPAFIPFYNINKRVRFVTIKTNDDKLKWVPKAMSE